jgi:hypothetical protein
MAPFVLVLLVWVAGSVLGVVRVCRSTGAARRLSRTGDSVRDVELRERLTKWSQRLSLREPPALVESPSVTVPTVSGWRRPAVLLPRGFSRSDPSCDSVLVHELAHVRRNDVLIQTAAELICALWWWQPLTWLLRRGLYLSAQEACDDWALSLAEGHGRYAKHLVRWAEVAGPSMAAAYASRGQQLVRRVRRVLTQTGAPQVRLSRRARVALVAATVVAALAGGGLRPQATVAAVPQETGAAHEPGVGWTGGRATTEAEITVFPPGLAAPAEPVPVQGAMVITRSGRPSTLVRGSSDDITQLPLSIDQADLSPDGRHIAYIDPWGPWPPSSRDIWRVGLDGRNAENLTEKAGISGVNCAPCWSPDGTMIAFHHSEVEPGEMPCAPGWDVWVMAADGSNARRVISGDEIGMSGQPLWFPRWTPDGGRLYCQTHGGVIEVSLDGTSSRVLIPLWGQVDLSPDGKRAAIVRTQPGEVVGRHGYWRHLILVDVDSGRQRVLVQQFIDRVDADAHRALMGLDEPQGSQEVSRVTGPDRPRWSPDGNQVAFVAALPFRPGGPPFRQQTEVWIYDLGSKKLFQVTNDREQEDWLSWR